MQPCSLTPVQCPNAECVDAALDGRRIDVLECNAKRAALVKGWMNLLSKEKTDARD
jgi:hypothetical protein